VYEKKRKSLSDPQGIIGRRDHRFL